MRDLATQALETLATLYDAASGRDVWPRALDAISELVGANGALLFVRDGGPKELQISAASSRYEAADLSQYLGSLVEGDEARWLEVLDELPPRTIQTDADIWPDRTAYDAMPSVRFLRDLHLYHRVAVRPCAHGGWKDSLAVLFDDRRGGIGAEESRRLALVVPHLARAIEMQRPFELLRRRFGGVLTLLDRLGMGVLVVRESGEVVLSNRESDRILDAGDGLVLGPGSRLAACDPEANGRLAAALRHAAGLATLEVEPRGVALEVPRRAAADPYLVDLAPFRGAGEELASDLRSVLLIVVDPDHRELVSVRGLARSYGLTATETLVCRMITQGITLRQIAETRGVSLDTVKSQSRAIYAKTRTRNRRELVRRALSILPPLLDRDGKRID
jgi:DNA-binding CsgD family transcriptional regulator